MTRGGNYHCSGTNEPPSVALVFAAGVDGVLENSYNMTGDNSGAAGMFSGCRILSLGSGSARANSVVNANVLTDVSFNDDLWRWHSQIILARRRRDHSVALQSRVLSDRKHFYRAYRYDCYGSRWNDRRPNALEPDYPLSGLDGSASKATAVFTETGSNNFAPGDTIQVGPITYTFATIISGGVHYVRVGPDFATSAANLVAAVGGTGEGSTYWPDVNRAALTRT